VNPSTGWLFHCAPLLVLNWRRHAFPRILRAAAFAPTSLPASLSLRSAKPPHSCRPGFELVSQPESLSVLLTRPFAPATMLGLAPLALRVWAYANGRPLHSGPFKLRDKTSRPPRVPFFAPLPRPVAKTCRLWLPLERLSSFAILRRSNFGGQEATVDRLPPNPARLGSPV
jgi:hypothetical protein